MRTSNLFRDAASSRLVLAAALSFAGITFTGNACADEDAQREALARIAHELARLEQLTAEAQRQQDANGRVRFRFDWLGRDLALVRRGIEDHADAPRQPRPVPVLRGDYRP